MKRNILLFGLLILSVHCWSDQNPYLVEQTQKKKSKVTVQECYEEMVTEMIWSSRVITRAGQNQTILLSYIDNSSLEKADQKTLQKIAQEEQSYTEILKQFDEAQKKHREFHEQIQQELKAKKA